jgi:hypothetical protein
MAPVDLDDIRWRNVVTSSVRKPENPYKVLLVRRRRRFDLLRRSKNGRSSDLTPVFLTIS